MRYNMLVFFSIIFLISFKPYQETRLSQEDFFKQLTKAPEQIETIYEVNKHFNKEPELLIALMQAESQKNPKAVNYNINGSTDRGIFQLNSNYFRSPYIFNILVNTTEGLTHFNWCMEKEEGNVENAIRRYNSGQSKITNDKINSYYITIQQYRYYLKAEWEKYNNDN